MIEPDDVFFRTAPAIDHYFRLGFQSIKASVINAGIAELAKVIRNMRNQVQNPSEVYLNRSRIRLHAS